MRGTGTDFYLAPDDLNIDLDTYAKIIARRCLCAVDGIWYFMIVWPE